MCKVLEERVSLAMVDISEDGVQDPVGAFLIGKAGHRIRASTHFPELPLDGHWWCALVADADVRHFLIQRRERRIASVRVAA
jgi:hypothetical protein